jgi:hypothetical protein
MNGKTVLQAAPARVARGMELPLVVSDTLPYVVCSKFPNGNYAIATLIRTDSMKGFEYPLADVTLICGEVAPVGVFGNFKSLTLNFEKPVETYDIWAQDLAGDKAIEITDLVERNGNKIKVSGELLKLVGLSAASANDVSQPGLIIVFKQ